MFCEHSNSRRNNDVRQLHIIIVAKYCQHLYLSFAFHWFADHAFTKWNRNKRFGGNLKLQGRKQSLILRAVVVHRGKAGKLWRQRDNETLSAIVTTKYPHMSQASTRAHCGNKVLQTCIRSVLIVLQQTEQRPQQTAQYQHVFETCAQPSILAGLVTTGLFSHTQCASTKCFVHSATTFNSVPRRGSGSILLTQQARIHRRQKRPM